MCWLMVRSTAVPCRPGSGMTMRQRLLQDAGLHLGAHLAPGQPCQGPGVVLPGDQCLQHRPPGLAEDAADHRRQLDLGVLQQLLRALLLPRPLLDQHPPASAQVPQLALPRRRDETRPQHPPPGQPGQPDRVQLAGLRPAGDVLDIAGVHHPSLDGVLEHVERGLPLCGSRLRHAQRHARGHQPVPQPQQRPRRSRERPHLLHT
jgi:hypothetical protein